MEQILVNKQVKEMATSKNLVLCLLFDFIGYLSYTVPFLGEFSDIIWAPIAAFLISRIFKGAIGKVGGVFTFIEEILPGIDFIPTFTITWLYCKITKHPK